MKPIVAVLLFSGIGATGITLAQSEFQTETIQKNRKTITITCEEKSSECRCSHVIPKVPKAPLPPLAPIAPEPPSLPSLPEMQIPPPAPPEPPEIIIPSQVHQACDGKAVGTKAIWIQEKTSRYEGTCVLQRGKMFLDVTHITITN